MPPDHPPDAFFDARDFPVEQEPEWTSAELQIGEKLGLVDRLNRLDGLVFDDDAPLNAHVGAIACVDRHAIVFDWDGDFAFDLQPPLPELMNEAALIGGLEEPRPECGVDFNSRIDNMRGNAFDLHTPSNGKAPVCAKIFSPRR